MKKENTSDRLKQIMSDRNLRQVDILEMCKPYCQQYNVKLGRNDLSQYVTGKVESGQKKLTVLGMALNVSEAWLMGFDVPMGRNEFKDVPQNTNLSFDNVEDFKKAYDKSKYRGDRLISAIIDNSEKLTNDGKKSLLDYSNVLLGNPAFSLEAQVNAAHARTDIDMPGDTDTSDNDVMDDENF